MQNAKTKMQKLKRSLRKDKRAVSPVIGVILMVAITVILAAVIGAFVFGVGAPPTSPDIHFTNAKVSVANGFNAVAVGSSDIQNVNELSLTFGIDPAAPITVAAITYPVSPKPVGGGTVLTTASLTGVTAGDRVRVLITHTPTGTVLMDQAVAATG